MAKLGKQRSYYGEVGPGAVACWLLLALLQYRFFGGSFLESMAKGLLYTGGLLVSAALIIRPLAHFTQYNFLTHRRTLGICGFIFMIGYYLVTLYLSHNGLLIPSLAASGLSFLAFIGEL